MGEIVLFIVIVLAVIQIYRILRSLVKRIFLIKKLGELKKTEGVTVKYCAFPLLSLLKLSSKPEVVVETKETVFLIRLFGASSNHRRVHFANPEFTVTIKGKRRDAGARVVGTRGRRYVVKVNDYSSPKSGKVRILPKLRIPDEYELSRQKIVPVLIFNPAPHDVTYVTPEKNKVVAAFTGDTVYTEKIYTASTFVTFADRYAREELSRRYDSDVGRDRYNYEYFS